MGGKFVIGHFLKSISTSACVYWPSRYVGVITNGWVGIINNAFVHVTHLVAKVHGLYCSEEHFGTHAVRYTITHDDFSHFAAIRGVSSATAI